MRKAYRSTPGLKGFITAVVALGLLGLAAACEGDALTQVEEIPQSEIVTHETLPTFGERHASSLEEGKITIAETTFEMKDEAREKIPQSEITIAETTFPQGFREQNQE
ncbi:MAG: hypothetical protein EA352_05370 [Gemmatimonadales bacterium]|nr:MAG: hypothetical protein EA352_05370 [Gemmatimonadales bacterium]